MTVAVLSPLRTLRARTHAVHRELERRLPLLSPGLDVDAYGELLTRFALVQPPLEAAVEAALAGHHHPAVGDLDLASRRKGPALRGDLGALGIEAPAPLPCPVDIDSIPAAVGALYVTEGATLGGAVITMHVREHLGPNVPVGFFASYGADVPARWASFRRAASALLTSRDDIDCASNAAAGVFGWFEAVLAP